MFETVKQKLCSFDYNCCKWWNKKLLIFSFSIFHPRDAGTVLGVLLLSRAFSSDIRLLRCVGVGLWILVFLLRARPILAEGHRSFSLRQDGEEGLLPAPLLQIRQDDLKHCRTGGNKPTSSHKPTRRGKKQEGCLYSGKKTSQPL